MRYDFCIPPKFKGGAEFFSIKTTVLLVVSFIMRYDFLHTVKTQGGGPEAPLAPPAYGPDINSPWQIGSLPLLEAPSGRSDLKDD